MEIGWNLDLRALVTPRLRDMEVASRCLKIRKPDEVSTVPLGEAKRGVAAPALTPHRFRASLEDPSGCVYRDPTQGWVIEHCAKPLGDDREGGRNVFAEPVTAHLMRCAHFVHQCD